MICCWAGNDGEFNTYEKARAWAVYITFPIVSLVLFYLISYFHQTRDHFEMIVRGPPTSMILILFTLWTSILIEAMSHLTYDLELAKEEWDLFINEEHTSISSILRSLSNSGYVFCASTYLFRIWMFWYRSGLSKAAQSFGDAIVESKKKKQTLSLYVKKRKNLGNKRKVGLVCFIWAVIQMTPILIIDIVVDTGENKMQMLRFALTAMGVIPLFALMIVLTWNVKNQFGVVLEYKMLLLGFIFTFGSNFVLLSTPLADTYYRLLISFEFKVFVILANYVWLIFFVRKFDIEHLTQNKRSLAVKRACAGIWNCWKKRVSMKVTRTITFKDYSLNELLSHRLGYLLFHSHVKETLCTENLLFFVDVYRHRKSLVHDPFIDLSEGASSVVRSCATLQMDWIDEEMKKEPNVVPSCKQIYKMYVKPFSQMEINIPGKMREQIVNFFEQKREKKTMINRISSIGYFLSRNIEKGTSVELSTGGSSCHWMEPHLGLRTLSTSSGRGGNNRISKYSGYRDAIDEHNTLPTTSIDENNILGSDVSFQTHSISIDNSIEYLYPAWTNLVNLLNNDSLVRFKMGASCNAKWREGDLDKITSNI